MIRRSLVVVALLAAAGAPAKAEEQPVQEEFEVSPHPALPGEVPAGSRADQILWRDAREAMAQGNQALRAAGMALYDLHYARLDLDQLEQGAAPADAERLRAIRAKLDGPAKRLQAAVPTGPLGRCRYEILYFQQSMAGEPGSDLAKRLPEKRVETVKCKEDHRKVLATVVPATAELRAVLGEVAPDIQKRMAAAHKESSRTTAAPPPDAPSSPTHEKAPASAAVKL